MRLICSAGLGGRLSSGIWIVLASTAAVYGQVNILTWHNDNARMGQNLQETILTPANVNVSTFGKLFVVGVDGKVDAQPLYVSALAVAGQGLHNVLFVVTEHATAYAFDADTGAPLWRVSLLGINETPSDDRGCGQVTPEIGITSTPAIDLRSGPHGTMYAVAMSKDSSGNYHQRLHALDLTTGTEEFAGPMEVRAAYPGSGAEGTTGVQTFDPKQHKDRAALVIANGIVYTSWGSHCDIFPYTGWVIGYNEATLAQVSLLNLTPNGNDGGIWASGSGPALDASGNLYLLMGNGTFDPTLNGGGFPVSGDYGNAFVKLSPAGAALAVADYFTMHDTAAESSADTDLGSGGAMVLPSLSDAQGQPRALAVGAGKDRHIYVVDRNNLGKYNASTNAIYQDMTTALNGAVFSSPAWFNGELYYGASGDTLKAFAFTNGTFGATPVSQSATVFGFPGTTPAVSATGASNGIVWAAENAGTAVLHAYDSNNLAHELYNSNQAANGRDHFGAGNKFIVPTVANGKVYVGTTTGVGVFGLVCFSIVKTHSGSFARGQNGATYSVTVSKGAGACATSGTVTVTESLPAGLTLVSMAGTGWRCPNGLATCTRSDALGAGASYPAITVTVNVAPDALSQLTNQVSVSDGESNGASASDPATIVGTCSSSLSSTGASVGFNSGTGSLSVTASTACAWTAASNSSFLTITSGASGTGNGTVGYSFAANPNGTPRSGTVTIAGQTFTVTQAGVTVSGLRFVAVTPCRVADTRNPAGPFGGPALGADSSRDFNLPASPCGIPANALAYSLNLTVVPLGPLGFLSVWPAGQGQPSVSTLNSGDGRIKANAAIVPAGLNGAVTLFASDPTHVIIDINGYFVPASGAQNLAFYPIAPCRLADTRGAAGTFAGPVLAASTSRNFPVLSGPCGIPASAQAYALNMTVVPTGPLGFLTAWPAGSPQPGSSTLNAPTGTITANMAIVPAGTGGAISVIATNDTHLIIDITGYFAPPGAAGSLDFYRATPCRILDTRGATGAFGGPVIGGGQSRSFLVPSSGCGIPATAKAFSLNATVVPPAPLGFLTLWGSGSQPTVSTLNANDGTIVANAALVPAGTNGAVTAFTSNPSHLILDINGYFQ